MYLCGIMRNTISTLFVFTALLLWGVLPAVAQVKTQDVSVPASLATRAALSIRQITPLFFGQFRSGTTPSTIKIAAAAQNPQLTVTGGATIISQQGKSSGVFRVSASFWSSVPISLSSNGLLTNSSGKSIPITYEVDPTTLFFWLGTLLDVDFYVGGTVTLGALQETGTYVGTYTVTANGN